MPPTIEELMQRLESLESRQPPAAPASGLPSDPDPQPVGPDGRVAGDGDGRDEEPVYSWEQLQQAVQDNKITEPVAQQIWADQIRRQAVKEASTTIVNSIASNTSAQKVEAEISRYRDLVPAVMDPSSEQRQRVVREFSRLTGELGYSKSDIRTELVALQAAFGPIDALAKAVKPSKHEGHRDVSHDDPGPADDDKDQDPDNTPPSSMSKDERRYYENAMRQGVYRNWGAVREELKFAKPRLRSRYGARV